MRELASARLRRLRESALLIVHASVAAAGAWFIATTVLDHTRPFFAPLAAIVIAVGVAGERRMRRIAELVVGVALGIGIGDALAQATGTGTWQLLLVVSLAMAVAVLIDDGRLFLTQAAVSAMLVVTIQPPGTGLEGQRFVDALIGGGLALLVAMILPANPIAAVDKAAREVLNDLAGVLKELAGALRTGDSAAALAALGRARSIEEEEQRWRDAVEAGYETARTAPAHRGSREQLDEYALAAEQADLAQRNIRVLARAVVRAIETGDPVPEQVPLALIELAEAFACVGDVLGQDGAGDRARERALGAVELVTLAHDENSTLPTSVIVGQVRSTAVDLLRALGEHGPQARRAVRTAAAEAGNPTS